MVLGQRTDPQGSDDKSEDIEQNALYITPEGAFDRGLPPIPAHRFDQERDLALNVSTPTCLIPLDLSQRIATAWPATTPAILARYIVIRKGEKISHQFKASGEVHYVLKGTGRSVNEDVEISWTQGDAFCFPGGADTTHTADEDVLLVSITDEPHLNHFRFQPPTKLEAFVKPAVFRSERIDEALQSVHDREGPQETAGKYVTFSTDLMEGTVRGTLMPTLLASVNSLEPGADQRSHIHNAAALTVCVQGEGVYSMMGEERVDWLPLSVMVTPPNVQHSHHNRGTEMMKAFVVQDGPLYYYLRATGFRWPDSE